MVQKNKQEKFVRIKYIKSAIGKSERKKKTVRSLGLRKLNQTVIHRATPQILGMINAVKDLVTYEFIDGKQKEE